MNPKRKVRVESLLKREIAEAIHTVIRDPRLRLLTITRCELRDSDTQLRAFYTVFGGEAERQEAAQALDRYRTDIQRSYAKVVRMRHLPLLRFAYDDQETRRSELDALIHRARASDPAPTPTPLPGPEDSGAHRVQSNNDQDT